MSESGSEIAFAICADCGPQLADEQNTRDHTVTA